MLPGPLVLCVYVSSLQWLAVKGRTSQHCSTVLAEEHIPPAHVVVVVVVCRCSVFGVPIRQDLVHRVVRWQVRSNQCGVVVLLCVLWLL